MAFYMFFPDSNNEKEKERIRKYKKQLEQEKQGRSISLGMPTEHLSKEYKVIEESNDHKVIDLQKPIKKNPTVQEFREVSGL